MLQCVCQCKFEKTSRSSSSERGSTAPSAPHPAPASAGPAAAPAMAAVGGRQALCSRTVSQRAKASARRLAESSQKSLDRSCGLVISYVSVSPISQQGQVRISAADDAAAAAADDAAVEHGALAPGLRRRIPPPHKQASAPRDDGRRPQTHRLPAHRPAPQRDGQDGSGDQRAPLSLSSSAGCARCRAKVRPLS